MFKKILGGLVALFLGVGAACAQSTTNFAVMRAHGEITDLQEGK